MTRINKMKQMIKGCLVAAGLWMFSLGTMAQLSTNPDKFLGNITTGWPGSMDYNGFKYSEYWNQVTPENGTKWGTVEGTRNSYYWSGADPAFKYAKEHGFPFKFHCLVWGSQYPNWIKNLSAEDRYKAIEKWMDKVKSKYPDLELIDVVNEAIDGHQADTYLMTGSSKPLRWLTSAGPMPSSSTTTSTRSTGIPTSSSTSCALSATQEPPSMLTAVRLMTSAV